MMIHRYFVAVVPVEMLVIVRDHIGLNVMILIFLCRDLNLYCRDLVSFFSHLYYFEQRHILYLKNDNWSKF